MKKFKKISGYSFLILGLLLLGSFFMFLPELAVYRLSIFSREEPTYEVYLVILIIVLTVIFLIFAQIRSSQLSGKSKRKMR